MVVERGEEGGKEGGGAHTALKTKTHTSMWRRNCIFSAKNFVQKTQVRNRVYMNSRAMQQC